MRLADSAGAYKCSEEDPRVMVLREVDEFDSDTTYYRLFPEGTFEDYDGEPRSEPSHSAFCRAPPPPPGHSFVSVPDAW